MKEGILFFFNTLGSVAFLFMNKAKYYIIAAALRGLTAETSYIAPLGVSAYVFPGTHFLLLA